MQPVSSRLLRRCCAVLKAKFRENGIKALQKRRYKKTTDSDHAGLIAPDILEQDFARYGPDQKWGVDIGYVWTRERWSYRAIVLGL